MLNVNSSSCCGRGGVGEGGYEKKFDGAIIVETWLFFCWSLAFLWCGDNSLFVQQEIEILLFFLRTLLILCCTVWATKTCMQTNPIICMVHVIRNNICELG